MTVKSASDSVPKSKDLAAVPNVGRDVKIAVGPEGHSKGSTMPPLPAGT